MEKITLKFMAFRVAITLYLPPSLFLSPSPLQPFAACIVTRWFGPFYFTRFMCSLWERTAKQVCALWGTCNMPHAPCPMLHAWQWYSWQTNVFRLRVFWPEVGGPNGAGKFARLMIDWWTQGQREGETDRLNTHTHTKTPTATEMDWELRWRRPVTALT